MMQNPITEVTKASLPPQEGEYWPGQGGIYAGTYRDGDKRYHLIFAEMQHQVRGAWGEYGKRIEGEFSFIDGEHNTNLILAADPDNAIAKSIRNLTIDGHNDFHWPAQKQLMLGYINAQSIFEKNWYWSSTQYSATSAYCQDFEDGYQGSFGKTNELRVRPVRRLVIC